MLREIANSDQESKPIIIHLTMYGEPFKEVIPNIPKDKPVVVVVGGAKVPGELFKVTISISLSVIHPIEVAALALFLDSWTDGEGFNREFSEPQLVISLNLGKDVKGFSRIIVSNSLLSS